MAKIVCKGFYIQGTDPNDLSDTDSTITQCTDGSYCCGNGTIGQPCCDQRKGVFLLNGETVSSNPSITTSTAATSSASNPSSSAAIPTSAITSSSRPSLPLTTSLSPPSQDKSPSGKTIGTIVGAVLGTALIVSTGFTIFLLVKSRRSCRQAVAPDQVLASQMVRHAVELYGDDGSKELEGRGHEVELDGVGTAIVETVYPP